MKFSLPYERLKYQRITHPMNSPLEIVHHLGAMQAQDYTMALWAIGLRMKQPNLDSIEQAFNDGSILRTHILRPTWHFVPGVDLKWMMQFSSPYITKLAAYQIRQAGLDNKQFSKTRKIIEKALQDEPYLTRENLVFALNSGKINTEGLRSIHILYDAECCGLICSGPKQGRHQTYALLDNRVAVSVQKNHEESLAELTRRYFTGHGPASIRDFAKWMSIPISKAKEGLNILDREVESVSINEQPHYFIPQDMGKGVAADSVFILPCYDEYMIGYADRTFAVEEKFKRAAMTINGIFNPIVLYHGIMHAGWKRTLSPKDPTIEFNWLYPPSPTLLQKLKKPLKGYEKFIGHPLRII